MMIATLALAQTDTPDIAQIEKYEEIKKEIEESNERLEEIKREIEVTNAQGLQVREDKKLLEMTVTELEELLKELAQIEKELAEQDEVEIVIPEVNPKDRETAADMQQELAQLQEQLAQLEKQLKDRTDVPTEANVTILPQGSGLTFVPHFVECTAGEIVMHNLNPPKRIRTAQVGQDVDFKSLLTKALNGKDDTIVFLLRDDGLQTYRTVSRICNSQEIRNGKIPVVGKGRIDLSAFAQ